LEKEKVLVIDDQAASRELIINNVLASSGYHAIEAESAEQALTKAAADPPDLIVLNGSSPDLGGLAILASLRRRQVASPVVMFLQADAPQLDAHTLQLGVQEIVTEPLTENKVQVAVERVLYASRSSRERDHLQGQLDNQQQEQKRLFAIGQAIAEQAEYALILHRLIEAAAHISRADEAHLFLCDPSSSEMRIQAEIKQGQERAQDVDVLVHDSLLERVLVSGEAHILSGPAAAAAYAPAPMLLDVPLKVRGKVRGVLRVLRFAEDPPFTTETIYKLSVLASYAVLALENLELMDGIRNAVERATLSQISAFFGLSLRLEDVLEMVMDVALRVVDGAYGYIVLLDERTGQYVPRVSAGIDISELNGPRLILARQIVNHVLEEGEAHLAVTGKTSQRDDGGTSSRSALCVPVRGASQIIGAIYVEQPDPRAQFTEHHRSMLATLSTNAAVAIENARLFDQVEAERRKLDAVLRGTEQPVIVTDVDGRVILMNRAAHRAFDTSEYKGTGLLLPQAIEHPELSKLFDQAQISDQVQHGEIAADGEQTFSATVTPIKDVGLVTVMQDITKIKKLSELKSEFVSTVSHDLRSPLSAIQGFLSVLDQAGPINEQQADFVASAQQEVTRLIHLTRDLLDLGRLESSIDLEMQRCDLKDVVSKAAMNWKSLAANAQHSLTTEVPAKDVFVFGNVTRLRQVLDNLISNAFKYTPPGGQIAVRLTQAGSEAVIQVQDTGIGIDPKDQPYVFDRFFRVKNDQTRNIEGTGLGLAIVRSVAERHGGRVWLESDGIPGKGTTIGVVLPVLEE
jgi:signal transduction histidine kinase/DNA-binding response OmpR family regulator